MRVHALEQQGGVAALIEELASPVEDEQFTVRGAAVTALGRLRAPEALPGLAPRLREDQSDGSC